MRAIEKVAIVLVRPKFSENIGFCARVCANFGVENLILVEPENFDYEVAKKTATNIGKSVLENIKIYDNLKEAVKDMNFVIGTTARLGKQRKVNYNVGDFTKEIINLINNDNRVAILFGNERTGLTNEELFFCDETITIPTFNNTSLNISHALSIILYEIYKNISNPSSKKQKLADPKTKEIIFNLLIDLIKKVEYIPHDNEILWMRNIKEFLNHLNLTEKDSMIFLGLLRATIRKLGG
mgnify:CR=1 FL=1